MKPGTGMWLDCVADGTMWQSLKAALQEERLLRWSLSGSSWWYLLFWLVVIAYFVVIGSWFGLACLVVSGFVLVLEIRDRMRYFRLDRDEVIQHLPSSGLLFAVESALLIAVIIFPFVSRNWSGLPLAAIGLPLLTSEWTRVIVHTAFDNREAVHADLRVDPRSSQAAHREFECAWIRRRLRRNHWRRLFWMLGLLILAVAVATALTWGVTSLPATTAVATVLLLASTVVVVNARRRIRFYDRSIPMPIRPLQSPENIACLKITPPINASRDLFDIHEASVTEAAPGVWHVRLDLELMCAAARREHVRQCRVVLFEQMYIRHGRPRYGAFVPLIKLIDASPMTVAGTRTRFSVTLQKAFAEDQPMRAIFGLVAGEDLPSDAVVELIYRHAVRGRFGNGTASISIIDRKQMDLMERIYPRERVAELEAEFNDGKLSARGFELIGRNPVAYLRQKDVAALKDTLDRHLGLTNEYFSLS